MQRKMATEESSLLKLFIGLKPKCSSDNQSESSSDEMQLGEDESKRFSVAIFLCTIFAGVWARHANYVIIQDGGGWEIRRNKIAKSRKIKQGPRRRGAGGHVPLPPQYF